MNAICVKLPFPLFDQKYFTLSLQVCAILSDATLIEQLKKEESRRKLTTREACVEVFGDGKRLIAKPLTLS